MNIDLTFVLLVDALLKSTALLLASSVILVIFRRASAANRHAILVAVLSAVLLLPFTRLIAPRWSITLDSNPAMLSPTELSAAVEIKTTAPAPSAAVSAVEVPELVSARMAFPWKVWLVAVWIAGMALFLARRLSIWLKLRSLAQSSVPISDPQLAALAGGILTASGTGVSARESASCHVPLVAGIIRPIVLLPADAREWDASRLSFALCHELGHVWRRDCLTRLLAEIVCALHWFNPLVWLAARQLRIAQEQACDDLVLKSGAPADAYAGLLVETVRRLQSHDFTSRHALAMAQPSTLETRVVSIMDETRNREPRSGRFGAAIGVSVAGVLALCAAAQLRAAPEPLSLDSANFKAAQKHSAPTLRDAGIISIADRSAELPPALRKPAPAPLTPEQAKEKFGWVYSEIEFREATVQEVADQLTASSRKLDPAGKGATVRVANAGVNPSAKVTLSLRNVPLIEVLANVAVRVQADVVIERGDAYLLRLKPPGKSPKALEGAESGSNEAAAAWAKADAIMLPGVDFKGVSVGQCLEFLRTSAKELDPAKQGVNLVLRPLGAAKEPSITLSLRNIPLSDALQHVAKLADLRIEADQSAITFCPLLN